MHGPTCIFWANLTPFSLETNLPWIMCHGAHANNTIETCNGCDCATFVTGLAAQKQPAVGRGHATMRSVLLGPLLDLKNVTGKR
jgi:hypothetical protein